MGLIYAMVSLLSGVIILNIGWTITYAVNPILAILFVLFGLFLIYRSLNKALPYSWFRLELGGRKVAVAFGIAFATVSIIGFIYNFLTNGDGRSYVFFVTFAIVGESMIRGKAIWK